MFRVPFCGSLAPAVASATAWRLRQRAKVNMALEKTLEKLPGASQPSAITQWEVQETRAACMACWGCSQSDSPGRVIVNWVSLPVAILSRAIFSRVTSQNSESKTVLLSGILSGVTARTYHKHLPGSPRLECWPRLSPVSPL